jgi:hypothetical protein
MKKDYLFLGLSVSFICITPVFADDLPLNIVNNGRVLPNVVDAAGYQCQIGNQTFVGIGTNGVDLIRGARFVSDKAKEDCENSNKFAKTVTNTNFPNTFFRLPAALGFPELADPTKVNNYELETIKSVKFGSWYCSVTGYGEAINYCTQEEYDSIYKGIRVHYCKGAIGYGETLDDAYAQVKDNFQNKNQPNPKLARPKLGVLNCGRVGVPELLAANSRIGKPRLEVKSKQNDDELEITILDIERKGGNVKYTCLAKAANGVYSEVPDGGGCKVTIPSTGFSYLTITAPLLGGVDREVKVRAQRVHTIEGDEIDDITRPGIFELSEPVTVPKITTTPVVTTPAPTEVQFNLPPKTPRIEITSDGSGNKIKSGLVHDVEETGVTYSCVTMSAVDGHAVPLDTMKYKFAPECTLLKGETGYSFQVPDSLNGQWFAIKATRGADNNGSTVFSNRIFLKDTRENCCTYTAKNYSEEGEIGTHCFQIPKTCDAPSANDVKIAFKDNIVNILFKSTRMSNTSMELFDYNGSWITSSTPKLDAGGSIIVEDKLKDTSRPYYDYRVYNSCPDKGGLSASYCPIRVYRDVGKTPLICDPKAEKPE